MEDLPVDILIMIALDMGTIEALKICRLSSKFNNAICNNANFWRRKIEKEYEIL